MSKKRMATYFLGVLPLLMVLVVYGRLPDLVPLQWDGGGVSRYGQKYELFLIGGIGILLAWIRPITQRIDPRRQNYEKFSDVYESIILLISGFVCLLTMITIFVSFHPNTLPMERVVLAFVGFMFMALGNMMPKVRSNFFMGIKTPWALSSEVVWGKTHRLGGQLFFLGGFAIAVCSFFVPAKVMTFLVLAIAIFICIVPGVMSYVWYQQEQEKMS